MPGFLSPRKSLPLLLIPEYSGINKGQRVPDRSKTLHRKPLVKCFLTELCGSLNILWHCPSLGLEWKQTFSIPLDTAEFPKFADILLAFFIMMLPKAHLTLHSRMSGCRWMITPPLLSGSLRSFLYSSSVYSCHHFLISSAFVRSLPFLYFIVPFIFILYFIFAWNIPLGL